MSGKISVYRGYRLRRWGDGIMVDYLRRNANPQFPRSFHWMDITCPADLERYIDCVLAGDQAAKRSMEQHHAIQVVDVPAPDFPCPHSNPVRIRIGLEWLSAIIAGTESCVLPGHAWIELRTDRNGCCPAAIAREMSRYRRARPQRSREEARYQDAHTAGQVLVAGSDGWVYHGWGLRFLDQQLHMTRFAPRFEGDLVSCRWIGPHDDGRYDTLRTYLGAINSGSRDVVRSATHQRWLADVTRYHVAEQPRWVQVSPQRLEAIVTGNDVLCIPVMGLQRTRRLGDKTDVPVAWDVRLVDARLDVWHAAAVTSTAALAYRDILVADQRQGERDRQHMEATAARAIVGMWSPPISL